MGSCFGMEGGEINKHFLSILHVALVRVRHVFVLLIFYSGFPNHHELLIIIAHMRNLCD